MQRRPAWGGDEEPRVVQSAAFRNCMCLWLQEKLVARPVSSLSAAEAMAGCLAWGVDCRSLRG